eukprot:TRINITY_DN36771_c0_g1_i1.p3 TRINITY_DN36771_c0_g1~~TRINITY_DN36771_c0_g1_i1.p3  ORF type:complete len:193 (+),score=19.84 TRINITY_DN36771_c0_g1_i1:108-686(+)
MNHGERREEATAAGIARAGAYVFDRPAVNGGHQATSTFSAMPRSTMIRLSPTETSKGPLPLLRTFTSTPGMTPRDSRRVLALYPALMATTKAFSPASTLLSVLFDTIPPVRARLGIFTAVAALGPAIRAKAEQKHPVPGQNETMPVGDGFLPPFDGLVEYFDFPIAPDANQVIVMRVPVGVFIQGATPCTLR